MTIGKRTRERSADDFPAPGSYNPDSAMNLTMPSSQGAVIKKDNTKRNLWDTEEKSPDPGSYYNAHKGFGYGTPRITLGGKYKWKPMNDNPGPGSHDASISLTRPKTLNIALSQS